MMNQFNVCFGILVAFTISFFIVPYQESPNLASNQAWRVILGLPSIFALAQILLILIVFRLDSPQYYEKKRDQAMLERVH